MVVSSSLIQASESQIEEGGGEERGELAEIRNTTDHYHPLDIGMYVPAGSTLFPADESIQEERRSCRAENEAHLGRR